MKTPERTDSVSWIQMMREGLQQVTDQGIKDLTDREKRITVKELHAYAKLSETPPILLAMYSSEKERNELATKAAVVFSALGAPPAFEQLVSKIQERVEGAWESGNDEMVSLSDASIKTSDEHQFMFQSYPGGIEQVVRETIQRAQAVFLSCLARPELPLLPNLRRDMVRVRPGVKIETFKGRTIVSMPTRLGGLFMLYAFGQNEMFPRTWLSIRIPEDALETFMPSRAEVGLFLERIFQHPDAVLSNTHVWRERQGKSNEETQTAIYVGAALKTYVFARHPFDATFENKTQREQLEMYNVLNAAAKKTANLWLEKDRTSRAARSIARHGFWASADMHQAFLCEIWPDIEKRMGYRLPS